MKLEVLLGIIAVLHFFLVVLTLFLVYFTWKQVSLQEAVLLPLQNTLESREVEQQYCNVGNGSIFC